MGMVMVSEGLVILTVFDSIYDFPPFFFNRTRTKWAYPSYLEKNEDLTFWSSTTLNIYPGLSGEYYTSSLGQIKELTRRGPEEFQIATRQL